MTFEEYQLKVRMTRLDSATDIYCFLNLAAEAGEVCALEAKLIRDGGDFEYYRQNLKKELGDVMWHVAAIALDHGFDLASIAEANIEKLKGRMARNTIKGNGDDR
jgi:NTP pyrophosphatase (non-canonical NTP hydrolase)